VLLVEAAEVVAVVAGSLVHRRRDFYRDAFNRTRDLNKL
jgi:hypothetical protein